MKNIRKNNQRGYRSTGITSFTFFNHRGTFTQNAGSYKKFIILEPGMRPCTNSYKNALIVKIEKDFALGQLPSLDLIFKEIRTNDYKVLAFDLSDVVYADFSALSFLLKANIRSMLADNRMVVMDASNEIKEMMKLTAVDTILTLSTREELEKIHTS